MIFSNPVGQGRHTLRSISDPVYPHNNTYVRTLETDYHTNGDI